jgi:hypothetical protein
MITGPNSGFAFGPNYLGPPPAAIITPQEASEGEHRVTWLWRFRNEHPELRIITPVFSVDERWHAFDANGDEIEEACFTGDGNGFYLFRAVMEDRFGEVDSGEPEAKLQKQEILGTPGLSPGVLSYVTKITTFLL